MCKQCENAIEQHKINVKSVKLYLCFRPFGYYSLQTRVMCAGLLRIQNYIIAIIININYGQKCENDL